MVVCIVSVVKWLFRSVLNVDCWSFVGVVGLFVSEDGKVLILQDVCCQWLCSLSVDEARLAFEEGCFLLVRCGVDDYGVLCFDFLLEFARSLGEYPSLPYCRIWEMFVKYAEKDIPRVKIDYVLRQSVFPVLFEDPESAKCRKLQELRVKFERYYNRPLGVFSCTVQGRLVLSLLCRIVNFPAVCWVRDRKRKCWKLWCEMSIDGELSVTVLLATDIFFCVGCGNPVKMATFCDSLKGQPLNIKNVQEWSYKMGSTFVGLWETNCCFVCREVVFGDLFGGMCCMCAFSKDVDHSDVKYLFECETMFHMARNFMMLEKVVETLPSFHFTESGCLKKQLSLGDRRYGHFKVALVYRQGRFCINTASTSYDLSNVEDMFKLHEDLQKPSVEPIKKGGHGTAPSKSCVRPPWVQHFKSYYILV